MILLLVSKDDLNYHVQIKFTTPEPIPDKESVILSIVKVSVAYLYLVTAIVVGALRFYLVCTGLDALTNREKHYTTKRNCFSTTNANFHAIAKPWLGALQC